MTTAEALTKWKVGNVAVTDGKAFYRDANALDLERLLRQVNNDTTKVEEVAADKGGGPHGEFSAVVMVTSDIETTKRKPFYLFVA